MADYFPGLQGKLRFGDRQVTHRQSSSVIGAVLGPAYGLANKVVRVGQGIREPTQSTVHTLRQMMLYNNVAYLSRVFTGLEHGVNNLFNIPKRRKSK